MEEEKDAFYVVRKGDVVGIYKNLKDCQAQAGSSQPASSGGKAVHKDSQPKRFQEVRGSVEVIGSTSISTTPQKLHLKLDNHLETKVMSSICKPYNVLMTVADVACKMGGQLTLFFIISTISMPSPPAFLSLMVLQKEILAQLVLELFWHAEDGSMEGIPPFSYFLVVSGRSLKETPNPNTQTPTPPTTHRPITRSVSRDHNSLVSEPAVMGDSVQDQLAKLFNLLLAEQQSNKELHAKFDALTQEWESTKKDFQTSSTGSPASLRRDKGISGTANSEKSGGSSFVPKFTKLDFPRYDGKDDPLGWLNRCKHFFQHQQTPEEEMVSLASYHLEGIAQLWYMQLLDDIPNPSWAEFSHQCNLRFGPPIRSNKLGELAKLKQMGSVADYQNQFEALVSRAGTLTQHQKVQLYLSGLQDSIAVEVELHHPTDCVNYEHFSAV
ncbi:hypothetical protein GH714_010997 [Hevea brasiliensis]|uniref:Uncharacterized protein n=1 Tax=Hevea brasiliensis TaxID=3981 RepID=A0A6A6M4J9_HEVBR|nr:hypothetical protein GH714_010997 [Hevea brasiliensis]